MESDPAFAEKMAEFARSFKVDIRAG